VTDHTPFDSILEAFDPKHLFIDLIAAVVWMLATLVCLYAPLVSETPLRIILGLPMVLFVPGYVLIAALFPGQDDLDLIERIALSFGLSIAVVPLIGLVLNYTPWGIRLNPIVASLALFTAGMVAIAQVRRARLPAGDRFILPLRAIAGDARSELFSPGQSRLDRTLSIVLIVLIVAAVATTAYVIVVPKEGEHFTEFYLLGEGGMAADYPERITAGDPQTVIVGIGNHEYRTVTYTVEAWLFRQTFDPATNTSTVHDTALMDRWTLTLPHNETAEQPYTFATNRTDCNRVQFLLFDGEVPPKTTTGAARINASTSDLHLWVDVVER
jgi:uncharacterized membrane protein